MEGNIIPVDYERSGWKYMSFDKKAAEKELESFLIGGRHELNCDILEPFRTGNVKGGGSAYGGKWRPNPDKPNEVILQGPPDTIQRYFIETRKEGYWVLVKYNHEGWAIKIRHFTDHGAPGNHTNPHDKEIEYDPTNGTPNFNAHPDIHYPAAEYPEGPPEFKSHPITKVFSYNPEAWRFQTLAEFKSSVTRGAEITFAWDGRQYHICSIWTGEQMKYAIVPLDTLQQSTYDSAEDMLSYCVGNERLRNIIKQAEILDRTL